MITFAANNIAMNIQEFEYHKKHFPYDACAAHWKENSWKREEFVSYFNPDKIASMEISEYVVGSGDTTTFCYGLWVGLMQLANIRSAFPTDFGVYYSKNKHQYVPDKRHWDNPEEAFECMKTAILGLLDAGKKEDLDALADNPLNAMVKGKILTTYFPHRYLSICSNTHINYYMKAFDLYNTSTKDINPVFKREILVDFKNNDMIMKDWSLDQFAYFLWGVFPKAQKNKTMCRSK